MSERAYPVTGTAAPARPPSRRLDALDGIRGVAIIAVFLHHARVEWAQGATTAISVFFPLSGFLITRNLMREIEPTGHLDFSRFWTRRARRLMPAAICGVAFAYVVGAWRGLRPRAIEVVAALTGWKNWQFLADGRIGDMLIIWWSLSIEEQYYLVYPIAMLWLLPRFGRKGTALVLAGVGGLSFAVVLWSVAHGRAIEVYYGTHGRLWEILAGCILALVGPIPRRFRVPAWVSLLLVVACQTNLLLDHSWRWQAPLRIVVCIVSTVWLIDAINTGTAARAAGILAGFPLRYLGVISYEIYLVHSTVLVALPPLRGIRAFTVAGAFALSIAIAMVVNRLVTPLRAK